MEALSITEEFMHQEDQCLYQSPHLDQRAALQRKQLSSVSVHRGIKGNDAARTTGKGGIPEITDREVGVPRRKKTQFGHKWLEKHPTTITLFLFFIHSDGKAGSPYW